MMTVDGRHLFPEKNLLKKSTASKICHNLAQVPVYTYIQEQK